MTTTVEGVDRRLVLVVDDEPGVRRAIARLVELMGHTSAEAETGLQGLEILRSRSPDLVITDLNMPEMDGIEFLLSIREGGSRVPVIAISGGGRIPKESLLTDADLLGAVETLPKPFEMGELMEVVRRNLPG